MPEGYGGVEEEDDVTYRRERHRVDWQILADFPPPIVQRDPRYVQETFEPLIWPGGEPVQRERVPMWHLHGVSWHDADPPPARHEHWPQTVGLMDGVMDEVRRCACGATYLQGGWLAEREPRVGPDMCRPCGGLHPASPSRWRRLLHWAGWWPR